MTAGGGTADSGDFVLDPIQASVLDYWHRARGTGTMPLLDALDPLNFDPSVLPYLIVAEYLDDRGRVRYRLAGEKMVERWGANFRGKRSDELFTGDYREHVEKCFALSWSERCPVYSEGIFRWNDGGWIRTTRVMLPFAAEPDGDPVRVIVVQVFLPGVAGHVAPEIKVLGAADKTFGMAVPIPDGSSDRQSKG